MKRDYKNIDNELQEISPFLAKMKRQKDGFEVPSGYFEHLENNILARIKAEEEVENWSAAPTSPSTAAQPSWAQRVKDWLLRPQLALGFSLALMAILAVGIVWNNQNTTSNELAISDDEALEYVQTNIDQFSENILLEGIGEEDWADVDFSTEIELNEAELNQYIEENLIDEVDESLINDIL